MATDEIYYAEESHYDPVAAVCFRIVVLTTLMGMAYLAHWHGHSEPAFAAVFFSLYVAHSTLKHAGV